MAAVNHGQRHGRSALLLYGSETGNSEECAEELGRMFQRLHFATTVKVMDEVEINALTQHTVVIFVISTTGQGEFPRNARKFWKSLLRKRLPPNCLGHVQFTTFGLGDSSYAKFNWTARKLHKRLEQLGAEELYPRGEGDDQHTEGWDGTFFSWKIDLGKQILEKFPLSEGQEVIPNTTPLPPKYILDILPDDERPPPRSSTAFVRPVLQPSITSPSEGLPLSSPATRPVDNSTKQPSSDPPSTTPADTAKTTSTAADMRSLDPLEWYDDAPPICQQLKESHPGVEATLDRLPPPSTLLDIPGSWPAELVTNKRVTPKDHWQDVRELSFLVSDSVNYSPGDVMTIYPKNFPEDVQALIELQGWQEVADEPLRYQRTVESINSGEPEPVTSLPPGIRMPIGSTLRDLLTAHLDITVIPKRNFLENMSYFTEDEMHKERLLEFCNPMYTDEFFDYTTRPRRSILEVLADFPSVQLPWNQAAHLFPIIRGRQFSITSGGMLVSSHHKNLQKVELLVAIVKYRTVLKKIRQGLCSRYLASLPDGAMLQVTFSRLSDKFYDLTFREPYRDVLMVAAGTGIAPCRALVWQRASASYSEPTVRFGAHLLIYGGRNKKADYFFSKDWEKRTLRTDVYTAFSRDQVQKVYVQDVIRKQSEGIYDLIMNGAVVYVCGSAGAMPKAVRLAFLDVLMEFLGVGEGEERVMDEIKVRAEKILDDMTKTGRYIEETW